MAPKLTVLFVLLGLVEARHCLYDNKGSLSACGRGCAMRPDSNICVSGCLSTRGVSRGCATCLGNGFQCAVRVCRRQCSQGFTTPTCTGCVRASCSRSLCKNAGKSALEEEQYNEEEASTILAAAAFPEPKAVAEEPKPNQTETVASETSERSGRCWEDQVSLKACGTQCYTNPNRGQCARTCLRGRGMSSNCANCFGDKVDCTIRKCLSQCASDSQSYACTSCVRGKCGRCAMEKSLEKSLDSDPSEGSWFDHMMEQIHNLQKEKKDNHTATPEAEAVQEANAIFP